ncbi:hypothetical protein SAMN05660860_00076 [Geoalkalibacter ferrihydriticus]|uniref:Doubled CXXCH domain-containing protein n=1 Tax=Geoalkalibacter ferrihydriticus TaxID=392333 RepID=A0A1G9IBQ5_9BACT|nr:hypothetical protein [Geoalkalibacter ferrihydriticus]SDL22274.1 hypothetical protein SAMN05660860_00076 [Geoalkalibacter ferrihydriticus]
MVRIPILIVLLLFFAGTCALAAMGPQRVANTVHNLSTSSEWYYVADEEDQVCIFCHTPHGGSLDGPLWNRALPGAMEFTHYTTATLDSVAGGATRALSDESLLCMSCHDGAMAVNHVLRPSSGSAGNPTMNSGQTDVALVWLGPVIAGRIGGAFGEDGMLTEETRNLTDDHPISFSYDAVRTAYQSVGRGNQLHSAVEAATAGVRFYGAGNRVECGSCHDPHVNYDSTIPWDDPTADEKYRPFLIMPNTGSAMCLACHNK